MRAEQKVDCGALSRQPLCMIGRCWRKGEWPGRREARRTLPAPAGPMTMTPYLLIFFFFFFSLSGV